MVEKTQLEVMIEAEAKELKEAPRIQPIIGQVKRCHICGQVFPATDLQPFDSHIPNTIPRTACRNCHPNRDIT